MMNVDAKVFMKNVFVDDRELSKVREADVDDAVDAVDE